MKKKDQIKNLCELYLTSTISENEFYTLIKEIDKNKKSKSIFKKIFISFVLVLTIFVILKYIDKNKINNDFENLIHTTSKININDATSNDENLNENINIVTSKSNKKSLSEIRGLIISGSKENMKKQLGEPDDDLSAFNFFKKYRNITVGGYYGSQAILDTDVIVYNNIELTDKPIAIIYYYYEGVNSVKYLSEVNNIEDLRP